MHATSWYDTSPINRLSTLLICFEGIRGNAEQMLQEAGATGKDGIDHLAFQTMMARKLGQVRTPFFQLSLVVSFVFCLLRP